MTEKPEEDAKGDEGAQPAAMAGLRAGEWALAGMLALAVVLAVWAAFGEKSRVIGPGVGLAVGVCWLVAAALAVKQRKRRSGRVALVVLGVLGALGLAVAALGMFGQGPSPAGLPARTAAPAGQETPDKTMAKLFAAIIDLDARRCMECIGGPEDSVRRFRELLDCLVASERLHQSTVDRFGQAGWETLTRDLEHPIITREDLKEFFGPQAIGKAKTEGDHATVEVRFAFDKTNAQLLRAGGWWRVVGGVMSGPGGMDAGTLAKLLALRIKVIAPPATVESLRKEFVAAFGPARRVNLPDLAAPQPMTTAPVALVVTAVVPTAQAPEPYVVTGRRLDLAGVRKALTHHKAANPRAAVLIRAERDVPHQLIADLIGACRECGYGEDRIAFDISPATQPGAE